ncbi:MAG: hypothetical protein R3F55_17945 [Alphaproteobacteria bacterium]
MMRNRSAFLACAIAGAFSATTLFATHVHARDVGPFGGGGGGNFRSECRPNDVLIGVNLRSGTALDAVVAICTPLNAERTEWAGGAYEPTQYWGGGGGGYQKVACQPGDVVQALSSSYGPWSELTIVKHISIQCRDLGSDYTYEVRPDQVAGTVVATDWAGCDAATETASGIFGGSGEYVDRIGLVCGGAPSPAPTSSAPIFPWDMAAMHTQNDCMAAESQCRALIMQAYGASVSSAGVIQAACEQPFQICVQQVLVQQTTTPPPPAPAPTAGTVVVLADVTGYPQEGGADQCYLSPGDQVRLIEKSASDPNWLHVAASSGGCAGQQTWVYNSGELQL